jgi:hypothetical protein
MTIGALVGALFERPTTLPANILHNERLRSDFSARARDAERLNTDRRTRYTVRMIITRGDG